MLLPQADGAVDATGNKRMLTCVSYHAWANREKGAMTSGVDEYFSAKGQEASERYFWKNAAEVYRLKVE